MAFKRPTTTATPDEIYDYWLPRLSNAELRVLLYIVRHTMGYGKSVDAISFKQFTKGITRKEDGKVIDEGCGLKSRGHITEALASLEEKDLISRLQQTAPNGGDAPTLYRLKFVGDEDEGWFYTGTGVIPSGNRGRSRRGTGGDPQPEHTGDPQQEQGGDPQRDPTINNVTTNNVQQTTRQQTTVQHPTTRTADAGAEGGEQGSASQEKTDNPAGGRRRSGRRKKEDQLELRVPLTHLEEETDEEWAAREFLSRVRGFGECGVPTFVRWTMDLAPMVKTMGRPDFARWVTWLASDHWLRENGYKMRFAKWQEEFETWWNKPEPRPLRRGGMAPAPARDERKIDNRTRDVEVLQRCVLCAADVGSPHYDYCELIPLGKMVAADHANRPLVVVKLQELRQGNAS